MNKGNVLFVAGERARLASIKIRCSNIAERLGCAISYGATTADQVPSGYQLYVCVKPSLNESEVRKLAEKGKIAWDVLDHIPPKALDMYITSTETAARFLSGFGAVHVIPHHHCNFERVINDQPGRKAVWVGHSHWYPPIADVQHQAIFIDGLDREANVSAYLSGNIGLNLRRQIDATHLHTILNPGIKLINCIGFGMPSLSNIEPAYLEIGDAFTVFSTLGDCALKLGRLLTDDDQFTSMRNACLGLAEHYHVDSVVARYAKLIESI